MPVNSSVRILDLKFLKRTTKESRLLMPIKSRSRKMNVKKPD